jgi:hypothetical protein
MYIVHAQGRAAAAVVAFVPSGAGVHVHVVVAFGRLSVVYAPVWYAT